MSQSQETQIIKCCLLKLYLVYEQLSYEQSENGNEESVLGKT